MGWGGWEVSYKYNSDGEENVITIGYILLDC